MVMNPRTDSIDTIHMGLFCVKEAVWAEDGGDTELPGASAGSKTIAGSNQQFAEVDFDQNTNFKTIELNSLHDFVDSRLLLQFIMLIGIF